MKFENPEIGAGIQGSALILQQFFCGN